MKYKINLNWFTMDILILLPITTLFQGIFPAINRMLFVVAIISLVLSIMKQPLSKKEVLLLFGFLLSYIVALLSTPGTAENTNEYFYLVFFLLYGLYITKNHGLLRQYCKQRTKYILSIICAWNACVVISAFFPSSYNSKYFFSFTGNVFRLATAATFVLSLIAAILAEKKSYFIHAVIPLLCTLGGGSRTYFAIALGICLIMYYSIMPTRKVFWISIFPVAMLAAIAIFNSNIMNRIMDSLVVDSDEYYQDSLIEFTSGRSLFWIADLRAYWEGPILNKLLGFGFNYVYDVNEAAIMGRIWAHNDFIHILLNYGLVGLICYLSVFNGMYHTSVQNLYISMWVKVLLWGIWFFNAFFNMFFTYVCAAVSYPLLILGISLLQEHRNSKTYANALPVEQS